MKISICNELFQGWPIEKVFEYAAQLGYDGVEIAPYTLADSVTEAHQLSEKSRALKDCKVCHSAGAEPFQSVVLTIAGPDGRPLRHAVQKDVLPYVRAFGVPLRIYGLNSIGLSRRGFSAEQRAMLSRAYKIVFRSNLQLAEAIAQLDAELGTHPEIAHFVAFLRGSQRGLTR